MRAILGGCSCSKSQPVLFSSRFPYHNIFEQVECKQTALSSAAVTIIPPSCSTTRQRPYLSFTEMCVGLEVGAIKRDFISVYPNQVYLSRVCSVPAFLSYMCSLQLMTHKEKWLSTENISMAHYSFYDRDRNLHFVLNRSVGRMCHDNWNPMEVNLRKTFASVER